MMFLQRHLCIRPQPPRPPRPPMPQLGAWSHRSIPPGTKKNKWLCELLFKVYWREQDGENMLKNPLRSYIYNIMSVYESWKIPWLKNALASDQWFEAICATDSVASQGHLRSISEATAKNLKVMTSSFCSPNHINHHQPSLVWMVKSSIFQKFYW